MWVTEVEFTHQARLQEVLLSRGVRCSVKVGNLKGKATLLLSECNITEPGVLPVDCYKYIFKTFHAPYQCRDAYWFRFHPAVRSLIDKNAIIRVQCVPKSMGGFIAEALIGEDEKGGILPENIGFSGHTHIFQCFYSVDNACFFWGVAEDTDPVVQKSSWLSLHQAVVHNYKEKNVVPVCRAYYKMQEIIEHYFPLWSWTVQPELQAVDIGASPGGWTQYIAVCMKAGKVLAVDPGDIESSVLNNSSCNVSHCRALAEAPMTTEALKEFGGFSMCVCDINCDARVAISLLIKHVLPFSGIFCDLSSDFDKDGLPVNYGFLVLTIKLAKNPKQKQISRAVNTVIDALSNTVQARMLDLLDGSKYVVKGWDFKAVHLNANSINERTVVCKFANVLHSYHK